MNAAASGRSQQQILRNPGHENVRGSFIWETSLDLGRVFVFSIQMQRETRRRGGRSEKKKTGIFTTDYTDGTDESDSYPCDPWSKFLPFSSPTYLRVSASPVAFCFFDAGTRSAGASRLTDEYTASPFDFWDLGDSFAFSQGINYLGSISI
jgi:hypothetical protein